ncbi:lysylphosphatidylglycerol synthase transmembrane domain-containing protein [Enterococcus olivae]
MKPSAKWKFIMNILVVLLIFGVMIYLIQNSLADILIELTDTKPMILFAVIFLGLAYQFFEGWTIRAIIHGFSEKFRIIDGMLTAFYVAFYRVITFGAGTLISEVNFYKRKGLKVSQGMGVTALHLMMYKSAILTFAFLGLVLQFPTLYTHAPRMIPLVLTGMIMTAAIVLFFLTVSISVNLQVFLLVICNKWLKSKKLRTLVDQCNLQIYSLRETVSSILYDKTALGKIYLLSLIKLVMWYLIPYVCLVANHPELDFWLIFSLISFTLALAGVIPSPAGIGAFEFVYLFLFSPLVGTVDAVSSMLLYRFASYVLPFLLGFIQAMIERKNALSNELQEIKAEKEKE